MFKLLLYSALLHTIFAQKLLLNDGFGWSYLNNSPVCRQWSCINNKLGLPNALPPKDQYQTVLQSLLPAGPWQDVAATAVDNCYGNRTRRYTNTCPGQALLHCTVDNLIQLCPANNLRKDDACAPLSTISGFKYMFSQSRYNNLEKGFPSEKRYLKNLLSHNFNSKCCEVPPLFKTEVLKECGFDSFIHYYIHKPTLVMSFDTFKKKNFTIPRTTSETVKVVNISENNTAVNKTEDAVKVVDITSTNSSEYTDPLDCCDLSGFIEPSWRSECGFQLSHDKASRLTVFNNSVQATTTIAPTKRPVRMNDVKVVPQPCEKTNCIFRKLNIVSENGSIDLDAFSKLLNNMTEDHTSWVKAKARVATKCLLKPLNEYVYDCEINKVLACTFDVLSENCPHAIKRDPCRHSVALKSDITCQISSSKFRPKNRRQFCGIPSLVSHEVLNECGASSLSHIELVPDPVTSRPKSYWWNRTKYSCQTSTESTKCLLTKMGALNKYGFIDYFKMKEKIRSFAAIEPWSSLGEIFVNSFTGVPMYNNQCSTSRKLLNVIDAMLMTCPMSKRKHTLQCNRILTDLADSPINRQQDSIREFLQMFNQAFTNTAPAFTIKKNVTGNFYVKLPVIPERPIIHKNPMFDFGFLDSKDAPKVAIIDLKKENTNTTRRPLVLLPVYMRMHGINKDSLASKQNDGIWRSLSSIGPVNPMIPKMP